MKIRPMFAWYDIWIGVFVDQAKRRIYVFPLPCFGFRIDLRSQSNKEVDAAAGRE